MSKILHTSHLNTIHRRTFSTVLAKSHVPIQLTPPPPNLPFHPQLSLQSSTSLPRVHIQLLLYSTARRTFSVRAFDSSEKSDVKNDEPVSSSSPTKCETEAKTKDDNGSVNSLGKDYPSGEFEFKEISAWKNFVVKLRMLIAYPWERVRKGSVLTMKLRGQNEIENLVWKNNSNLRCGDSYSCEGLDTKSQGQPEVKNKAWTKFDQKACSTIPLCLNEDIKHNIMGVTSTKVPRDKLGKLYLEKSLTIRVNLNKLFYLRMVEGITLLDHLNEFNRLLLVVRPIKHGGKTGGGSQLFWAHYQNYMTMLYV